MVDIVLGEVREEGGARLCAKRNIACVDISARVEPDVAREISKCRGVCLEGNDAPDRAREPRCVDRECASLP